MVNAGFTKEGVTFPSRHAQLALEQQVCHEGKINPADICYVEAHGTGTVAGDGQELDAINKHYGLAPGRVGPVLIGSVKSNMGHCEGNSCLASAPCCKPIPQRSRSCSNCTLNMCQVAYCMATL